MNIKTAYEVYSLIGGGYNKRHLHGYAWTKEDAEAVAATVSPRRYYVGAIHVVEINGSWHRINVTPIEGLIGDVSKAQTSRLLSGETVPRSIPSINFQIDDAPPRRLGLDFEYAIDMMASYSENSKCRLYTLRTGGKLPMSFRVRDLLMSSHTQQQVSDWLSHEINFRLAVRGEVTDEAAR